MAYSLKSFNTGQVTLPKKWRDKQETKHFIARETQQWLLISPVKEKEDVVYYENSEGFGIYSESWIDGENIISQIKKLQNG